MVWPGGNLGASPLVPGGCVVLWKCPMPKNVLCSHRLTCWPLLICATLCRRPRNWSSIKLIWGRSLIEMVLPTALQQTGLLLFGAETAERWGGAGRTQGEKGETLMIPLCCSAWAGWSRSPPGCDERAEETQGTLCYKQMISLPAHFLLVVNKNLQNERQSLTCNQSSLRVRFFRCSSINSIFVN